MQIVSLLNRPPHPTPCQLGKKYTAILHLLSVFSLWFFFSLLLRVSLVTNRLIVRPPVLFLKSRVQAKETKKKEKGLPPSPFHTRARVARNCRWPFPNTDTLHRHPNTHGIIFASSASVFPF